ncbi:polypeptide n-acetylgalactosaminyltransferase [Plakobranchus ocellatus]|uniref:Polypeptide n-acetylgalactosaminyltransferase n=1 Tax=Plakobranchus ocellatus TaxID=259542 RepID=A0AAV4DD63_9GAST|nr:polypeptide n-acetylgalactosaminyltransferase [Plakobranchus ocellatus]
MASFLRRRRSFLIKLLLLVPVLYLIALAVFSLGGKSADDLPVPPFGKDSWHAAHGHDARDLHDSRKNDGPPPPPVPDNDGPPPPPVPDMHGIDSHQFGNHIGHEAPPPPPPNNQVNPPQPEHDGGLKGQPRGKDSGDLKVMPEVKVKVEDVEKEKIEELKEQPHDPNAPGENGRAVSITKEKLSEEERKKFDEGWKNNAYNQYASDMISLHRSLPDVRDKE